MVHWYLDINNRKGLHEEGATLLQSDSVAPLI